MSGPSIHIIAAFADELLYFSGRRMRILEKVMKRVRIVDCGYETPCWLYEGSHSGNGRGGDYARMNLDGGTVAVHIAMWTNEHGLIPPKKQLDHLCRKRRCVRPSHLELVTHKENQKRRAKAKKCDEQFDDELAKFALGKNI